MPGGQAKSSGLVPEKKSDRGWRADFLFSGRLEKTSLQHRCLRRIRIKLAAAAERRGPLGKGSGKGWERLRDRGDWARPFQTQFGRLSQRAGREEERVSAFSGRFMRGALARALGRLGFAGLSRKKEKSHGRDCRSALKPAADENGNAGECG